jgi:hypothetical protein
MPGPKKGVAYTYYIALTSQADTDLFKTSVTLAAGDVTTSLDGAAFGNIASLPVEIGTSGVLAVTHSDAEMNGDVIVDRFHDAAGDEWQDALVVINTETGTISEIDTNVDDLETRLGTPSNLGSGATVAANLVDIEGQTDDIGVAGAGLTALGDARLANLDGAVSDIPEAVDTELTASHGDGSWLSGAGSGSVTQVVTVNDANGDPLDGAQVTVYTDTAKANLVASGFTNTSGQVTFELDAGTYYVWKSLAGYNFANPSVMAVS